MTTELAGATLDVMFRGESAEPKALALIDNPALTQESTLADMGELPRGNGYERYQISDEDWSVLQGEFDGMQTSLSAVFGPPAADPWKVSHIALITPTRLLSYTHVGVVVEVGQELEFRFEIVARAIFA